MVALLIAAGAGALSWIPQSSQLLVALQGGPLSSTSARIGSAPRGSSAARDGCRPRAPAAARRSTRATLTEDGEQFLAAARHLVSDADNLAGMFQTPSNSRGRVRVDLPHSLARSLFIPHLPELLAAHPQLEVLLSTTDRRVDLIREGFDCVLRMVAMSRDACAR